VDEEDDVGSEGEGDDEGGDGGESPIEYVDLLSPPLRTVGRGLGRKDGTHRAGAAPAALASGRPLVREGKGLGDALGDGARWVDGGRAAWGQQPLLLQPQPQRQQPQQPTAYQLSPYERAIEKQRKKQGKPWAQRATQQHEQRPASNAAAARANNSDILASISAGGPTHRPWKKAGGGVASASGAGGWGEGGSAGGVRNAGALRNQEDSGDECDDPKTLSYSAAWSRDRAAAVTAGARTYNKAAAASAERDLDDAMRERSVIADKREAERAAAKVIPEP
jgi:hypothetical protein